MVSKAVLATLLSFFLVLQDGGGGATALLRKQRKAINVQMVQLANTDWYLAAMLNALPEERHERCAKASYTYNEKNDEFIITRTSMAEGSNDMMTVQVSDVYNTTMGVFEAIPRGTAGISINLLFLEHTPGESFIVAHCEIREGKLYTDRITVAFVTRNVDPQKIHQKLRSIGIDDFSTEWIIPQTNCND